MQRLRLIAFCGMLGFVAGGLHSRASGGPAAVQRRPDGIRISLDSGFLTLQIKADNIVRVLFSKVPDPRVDDMVAALCKRWPDLS